MSGPSTSFRLRVVPRAPRPGVVGRHGDAWKVRVTAAPEDGKANEAVLELLSGALDVPPENLRPMSGKTSRDKVVSVRGMSAGEVNGRLAAAGGAAP